MSEIKVNGISYYYELHGNGNPLIFIAGFGANHTVWRYVYPAFIDRYQVLIFDNPASGRTRDREKALTVESMADGVTGLIDRLDLKKPCIVGHSMGGSIAQILAVKYPEKTDRLVIVNSVSRWNGRTMMAIKGLIDTIKNGVPLDCQLDVNLPWLFGKKALGNRDRTAALRGMILDNPTPPTIKELERQYQALSEFDSSGSLEQIKVPVLVVISDEDILALPAESEELAENISGARIARLPGGHASEYEEPEKLIAAIESFLG
jgi:pimeloyl-ACP methyl ester carboxylesterase